MIERESSFQSEQSLRPSGDVKKGREVPEALLDKDVGPALSRQDGGQLCPAQRPAHGQQAGDEPD